MRLWADRPDTVQVRWFFCDTEARLFPFPHRFGARVWRNDKKGWYQPLPPGAPGELGRGGGVYDPGANVIGYRGVNFCGRPQAFLTGGITGVDPEITTSADGSAACCRLARPGIGGVRIDGGARVSTTVAWDGDMDFIGPGTMKILTPIEMCDEWDWCYSDLNCFSLVSPVDGLTFPSTGAPVVRMIGATGPLVIRSAVPLLSQQMIRLVNDSGFAVTLEDNYTGVSAGELPFDLGGADVVLGPHAVADLWAWPDSGGSPAPSWRVLGGNRAVCCGDELCLPSGFAGGAHDDHPFGPGHIAPCICAPAATLRGIVYDGTTRHLTIVVTRDVVGIGLPLTLGHNAGTSSAGNRIYCPGAVDYVVRQMEAVLLAWCPNVDGFVGGWVVCAPAQVTGAAVASALDALGGISGSV